MATDRVTVTLPSELRELHRRRRAELHRSLRHPHPESRDLAELGLRAWAKDLPNEDSASLVNPKSGKGVRWQSGRGWIKSASRRTTAVDTPARPPIR